MNLLTRIKAAFDNRRWVRSSMQVISGDDSKRQPFSYSTAVRYYSSWIYAAATINAVTVAAQPLRLYVRRRGNGSKLWGSRPVSRRAKAYLAGDAAQLPSRTVLQKVAEYGDDYEVVTERHPILDLLSSMNPYSNGFDATVLRVLYGELTGNAYLHPVIDRRLGVPVELWTMPSQWVEIVPGKEGEQFIRGYRYGTTTEQRAANFYEPDEVIHFRRPNPNDLYYGIGKVEAAWGATMQNAAVHEMDLSFFENKARPDYLLTVKGDAHPDELERLEAAIDQKLRGKSRTGRFLASTAEIDVKPLGFPPKDLQGRDEIVEEIAAVFGVPVSMLKANDPNLASATTGYAMWRETTILPLLRMDEEVLNQNLLPLFDVGEDAFLAYDNPVKTDERFEFEKMRGLVAGGIITANEARQMEGLEPVADDENANRLLINGQPLGGTPQAAIPFGASKDDRQVLDSGSPDQLVGPLDHAADREEPPEAKAIESKDALSDCVSEKIPLLIDDGYPQDQAVAIAYSMCSEGKSIEEAARANTKAVGDVDTKPPQSVADNARRALEVRETKPMSERGMTAVGIARARDLANRAELSEDTIRRMVAYFERHQSDKQGSTWDEQGKGWQAWNGWGGDEGWAWAKRKVEEFDRAREKRAKCGCGCGLKRTLSQKALWAESVIGKASERDAAREQREIREDEKEIADKVSKVLDEQVRAVIAEIRRATVPSRDLLVRVEKLLAANRWNTRVTDALRPYLRAALEAGADLGVSTVSKQVAAAGAGVPGEPPSAADMFGVAKDDLRAYAQSESVRLARRAATAVNQYTSVRVAEIVGQTIADGASIADIADRVQEWAGEKGDADRLVRNRAVTIARTEANRATRVAEVEAWKATGAVVGKTWLLAPDPCEFCEAASKAFSENPVGLDRPFYEKGAVLEGADGGSLALDYEAIEGPPLHPNCRCSLQPQLRDDLEDIVREIAESGDVDRARQEIYESDMRSNP